MAPSKSLLEAIAVTAELTGTELSKHAARVMAEDLATYPEQQILGALVRCRRELRARLTIADIVARLDDGRPGPEEAWSICSVAVGDEGATIVWTEEMRAAMGVALPLHTDRIAARMAFKEAYERALQRARNDGTPCQWGVSLGWREDGRTGPIVEAIRQGRLAPEAAIPLIPQGDEYADAIKLLAGKMQLMKPVEEREPLPTAKRDVVV